MCRCAMLPLGGLRPIVMPFSKQEITPTSFLEFLVSAVLFRRILSASESTDFRLTTVMSSSALQLNTLNQDSCMQGLIHEVNILFIQMIDAYLPTTIALDSIWRWWGWSKVHWRRLVLSQINVLPGNHSYQSESIVSWKTFAKHRSRWRILISSLN